MPDKKEKESSGKFRNRAQPSRKNKRQERNL